MSGLEGLPDQPGGRTGAPGELALVRAFINTLDLEGGTDVLASPEVLGRWLRKRRLLEAGGRIHAERDLARAQSLREALRAVLRHTQTPAPTPPTRRRKKDTVESMPLDAPARATIEQEAGRARLTLTADSAGTLALTPRATGLTGALGRLLAIVAQAQIDGSWSRLRVCANDVCQWAFYDASRNRSGRWCSMAICGNRTKVRAHRTRHRNGTR